MGVTITFIIMGLVGAGILGLGLWVIIDIERHKLSQWEKWKSLPRYKVYCDMLYKKEWSAFGHYIMPEHLWYRPEYPMAGETAAEMQERCDRYNKEPALCEMD